MSDAKKVAKTVLDPSGFLSGEATIQSALDPGGALIKKTTGSDIGQRIADPLGLISPPKVTPAAETPVGKIQRRQEKIIETQEEVEKGRLKQSVSEVGKRKALMSRGSGRSLLIKTSPLGIPRSKTLGG